MRAKSRLSWTNESGPTGCRTHWCSVQPAVCVPGLAGLAGQSTARQVEAGDWWSRLVTSLASPASPSPACQAVTTLRPGSTVRLHGETWRLMATPGHLSGQAERRDCEPRVRVLSSTAWSPCSRDMSPSELMLA